ncbi:hypothetical protein U1Q18_009084 [Sarracenia purpurea var. burkii]
MAKSDNVASNRQRCHFGDRRRRHRNVDLYDYFSDEPWPKSRRRKRTVDRIGSLPDSLLVHILSFLPIEDAIRTEILSKRWNSLWTYVPSLLFCFCRGMPDDFVSFIDKTLLRCSCPKLKKLGINLSYYEPRFASNFNLWTRFAAVNGTEELHLELDGVAYQLDENDRYVFPHLLFANSSFRKLRFSLCSVVPTGVVCWKSLKKLSIGYVKLSDYVIQEMLVGSPVLEILELYNFYGVNRLHITSASVKKLILKGCWIGMSDDLNPELEISMPNLQSLEILGAFGELDCRLVDVTSLVEVTLDFDMKFVRQLNILSELLESLVNVKNIKLGTWAIQYFSRTLEELFTFDEKHYWTSQKRIFKCLMLNLKKVEFSGFIFCRPDCIFSFTQFLLKNAMVLQKMVIDINEASSDIPKEVFQAAQKLLSFPRSSSDAVVMLYA